MKSWKCALGWVSLTRKDMGQGHRETDTWPSLWGLWCWVSVSSSWAVTTTRVSLSRCVRPAPLTSSSACPQVRMNGTEGPSHTDLPAFWRWGVFPDRNSSLWTFDRLTGQVRRDLSWTHFPSSQVVVFKTVGFLCNLFGWGLWSPVNYSSVLSLKPNKKSLNVSAEVIKTRLVSEALSITQRIVFSMKPRVGAQG